MDIEGLTITRHDEGDKGEYRAHIAGTQSIGRLTWVLRGGDDGSVRIAEHTLVPREIGGRGVAAKLVEALVEDARESGFNIVPQCSYVAKKFEQNPSWDDVRA